MCGAYPQGKAQSFITIFLDLTFPFPHYGHRYCHHCHHRHHHIPPHHNQLQHHWPPSHLFKNWKLLSPWPQLKKSSTAVTSVIFFTVFFGAVFRYLLQNACLENAKNTFWAFFSSLSLYCVYLYSLGRRARRPKGLQSVHSSLVSRTLYHVWRISMLRNPRFLRRVSWFRIE